MVQMQPTEKLHAACDECRTRKLKCSGDIPACRRCGKEKISCIYSPQKQMGRPRKRRRDGEADEPTEPSVEGPAEYANILHEFPQNPNLLDFTGISPPPLQDADSSAGSTGHEVVTPAHYDFGVSDPFGMMPDSNPGYALGPPVDPWLWDSQSVPQINDFNDAPYVQSNADACTCLTLTYLTLSDLQSVQIFSFPQVVIPLRRAMSALSDLIKCPLCPKETFSAIQNVQSVVALFKAVVERFNKVLLEIDREASSLEATGQKKPYRVGDNNPALSHLHTGTLDCPMGFNIELEAKDWKRIVKTALKTEVYGGGSNARPLLDLVKESEERQEGWHNNRDSWNDEMKQLHAGKSECDAAKGCEALGAHHIRRTIDNLKWD